MTTSTLEVHKTDFNKYVPFDKLTYKKLKQINHLINQRIVPWAYRWAKSRSRLPKNRHYRLWSPLVGSKQRMPVEDSWVCGDFWKITGDTYEETPLLRLFRENFQNAHTPQDTPESVKPVTLNPAQIDRLWALVQSWGVDFTRIA